ncbi:GGDEF domain-containing protein, partial [Lacticaseibacillus manihotivorans]
QTGQMRFHVPNTEVNNPGDTFDNHDDHPLALITIDVDHFKQINDTYGHLMGNQTLIAFSRQLKQLLSNQNDSYKFYHTGGEEFAILLPNTSLDTARKVVHDCQLALKTLAIPLTEGQLQVTASFGLAVANPNDNSATNFFKRSDRYLYQSKNNGRDRLTDESTDTDLS